MIKATPRTSRDSDVATTTVHLVQGEHRISDDPRVMLTTILGSCVAACIRDPFAGIGGMNHFLLPGAQPANHMGEAERYAAYLMELLVNALLTAGAKRGRLEAKIFGGASMLGGTSDVGERNGIFASEFLAKEGIEITSRCLGGLSGRRIQYWPVSGRARRHFIGDAVETTITFTAPPSTAGSLELF